MKEKDPRVEKIMELCHELPVCCESFLMETGTEMANSTRLAYAHELAYFFDYAISYIAAFDYDDKSQITLDDIKLITASDISMYLTVSQMHGLKERTLARKRAALSRFFTYLTNNRMIPFNPVLAATKVKIHTSDDVVHLTANEQVSFIDSVNYGVGLDGNKSKYHDRYRLRDTALFTMLLDTGIRVSEIHGCNVGDVDFKDCSVVVMRKGGNEQHIYFSNETKEILEAYLETRRTPDNGILDADPLFATLNGSRLSIRAIQTLTKKYTSAALPGKGRLSPHKMRSSFAMAYYEETKDILALQRKLGHKNLTATNIYAKATDKKMQETRSVMENVRNRIRNE